MPDHQGCNLRIAGLLERVDDLERQLEDTENALVASDAANANLKREIADLRARMEEFAVEVEPYLPKASTMEKTLADAPMSRSRAERKTAQLPAETMRDVIYGGLR